MRCGQRHAAKGGILLALQVLKILVQLLAAWHVIIKVLQLEAPLVHVVVDQLQVVHLRQLAGFNLHVV